MPLVVVKVRQNCTQNL